jgi:pyruvate/2-oxoglutarate dehydrogenase complex dihydrolipoamide dehydrogenase (E3) component
MKRYDAIIIGTGQAGTPLAKAFSAEGLSVAIIERGYTGGSCVNWGCTPTKTMVASAEVSHIATTAAEVGIIAGKVQTDFKKVIERRNAIVEKSRKSVAEALTEDKNIDLIRGEASFAGAHTLHVKVIGINENLPLQADKVFINTGTSPRIPDIKRIDTIPYYTSRSVMELEELPEHLIIVGGSYIGLEFGQMYRRLGSQVTIIEQGKQLASGEDDDIVKNLQDVLEEEGIRILLNADVAAVERKDNGLAVMFKNSTTPAITGSHLLLAIGTVPNTDILNLEKAGIRTDERGYIEVNEKLETSVAGVYALGDCKGGPEFTHISYDDYRIVQDNLFGDGQRSTLDRPEPYTMFTKPELGRIGLSEKQARKQGKKYKLASMPMHKVARAIESNRTNGVIKVLVDPSSKQILGAACLADNGGEMMSMLQIAMMGHVPYTALREAVFAHPTYAEMFNKLFGELKDPA